MSVSARWLVPLVVLVACPSGRAQVTAAAGVAPVRSNEKVQTVPRVPGLSTLFDGLNAGVTYSGVHNSAVGWYSLTTPAIGYTFSRHFSADASTSLFVHRMVENTNTATKATQPLAQSGVDPSDTLIGFHAFFEPGALQDTVSVSMTAPTGDRARGFGAGQATFDFSNHTERYFKQLGVLLDLGAGNSSGLFNDLVVKDYSSVGAIAHFETGLVYWFPRRIYFEAIAYEQLPLGSQTIYQSGPRGEDLRGGEGGGNPDPAPPPITVPSAAEDNGFTTFFGVPLNDHITFSGYYNRSLRQRLDTVSFGMTYVLRGTPRRRLSLADRAIQEAERPNH